MWFPAPRRPQELRILALLVLDLKISMGLIHRTAAMPAPVPGSMPELGPGVLFLELARTLSPSPFVTYCWRRRLGSARPWPGVTLSHAAAADTVLCV